MANKNALTFELNFTDPALKERVTDLLARDEFASLRQLAMITRTRGTFEDAQTISSIADIFENRAKIQAYLEREKNWEATQSYIEQERQFSAENFQFDHSQPKPEGLTAQEETLFAAESQILNELEQYTTGLTELKTALKSAGRIETEEWRKFFEEDEGKDFGYDGSVFKDAELESHRISEEDLAAHESFIKASKTLYKMDTGASWDEKADANGLIDGKTAGEWGIDYMSRFENQTEKLVTVTFNDLENATPDQQMAFLYAYNTFSYSKNSWESFTRAVKYTASDPVTWGSVVLGLATGGLATIATRGTTTAAVHTLRHALTRSLTSATAKTVSMAMGLEGTAEGGIRAHATEQLNEDTGKRDYSYLSVALGAGIGGAADFLLGGILGAGADFAVRKISKSVSGLFSSKVSPENLNAALDLIDGKIIDIYENKKSVVTGLRNSPATTREFADYIASGDAPPKEIKTAIRGHKDGMSMIATALQKETRDLETSLTQLKARTEKLGSEYSPGEIDAINVRIAGLEQRIAALKDGTQTFLDEMGPLLKEIDDVAKDGNADPADLAALLYKSAEIVETTQRKVVGALTGPEILLPLARRTEPGNTVPEAPTIDGEYEDVTDKPGPEAEPVKPPHAPEVSTGEAEEMSLEDWLALEEVLNTISRIGQKLGDDNAIVPTVDAVLQAGSLDVPVAKDVTKAVSTPEAPNVGPPKAQILETSATEVPYTVMEPPYTAVESVKVTTTTEIPNAPIAEAPKAPEAPPGLTADPAPQADSPDVPLVQDVADAEAVSTPEAPPSVRPDPDGAKLAGMEWEVQKDGTDTPPTTDAVMQPVKPPAATIPSVEPPATEAVSTPVAPNVETPKAPETPPSAAEGSSADEMTAPSAATGDAPAAPIGESPEAPTLTAANANAAPPVGEAPATDSPAAEAAPAIDNEAGADVGAGPEGAKPADDTTAPEAPEAPTAEDAARDGADAASSPEFTARSETDTKIARAVLYAQRDQLGAKGAGLKNIIDTFGGDFSEAVKNGTTRDWLRAAKHNTDKLDADGLATLRSKAFKEILDRIDAPENRKFYTGFVDEAQRTLQTGASFDAQGLAGLTKDPALKKLATDTGNTLNATTRDTPDDLRTNRSSASNEARILTGRAGTPGGAGGGNGRANGDTTVSTGGVNISGSNNTIHIVQGGAGTGTGTGAARDFNGAAGDAPADAPAAKAGESQAEAKVDGEAEPTARTDNEADATAVNAEGADRRQSVEKESSTTTLSQTTARQATDTTTVNARGVDNTHNLLPHPESTVFHTFAKYRPDWVWRRVKAKIMSKEIADPIKNMPFDWAKGYLGASDYVKPFIRGLDKIINNNNIKNPVANLMRELKDVGNRSSDQTYDFKAHGLETVRKFLEQNDQKLKQLDADLAPLIREMQLEADLTELMLQSTNKEGKKALEEQKIKEFDKLIKQYEDDTGRTFHGKKQRLSSILNGGYGEFYLQPHQAQAMIGYAQSLRHQLQTLRTPDFLDKYEKILDQASGQSPEILKKALAKPFYTIAKELHGSKIRFDNIDNLHAPLIASWGRNPYETDASIEVKRPLFFPKATSAARERIHDLETGLFYGYNHIELERTSLPRKPKKHENSERIAMDIAEMEPGDLTRLGELVGNLRTLYDLGYDHYALEALSRLNDKLGATGNRDLLAQLSTEMDKPHDMIQAGGEHYRNFRDHIRSGTDPDHSPEAFAPRFMKNIFVRVTKNIHFAFKFAGTNSIATPGRITYWNRNVYATKQNILAYATAGKVENEKKVVDSNYRIIRDAKPDEKTGTGEFIRDIPVVRWWTPHSDKLDAPEFVKSDGTFKRLRANLGYGTSVVWHYTKGSLGLPIRAGLNWTLLPLGWKATKFTYNVGGHFVPKALAVAAVAGGLMHVAEEGVEFLAGKDSLITDPNGNIVFSESIPLIGGAHLDAGPRLINGVLYTADFAAAPIRLSADIADLITNAAIPRGEWYWDNLHTAIDWTLAVPQAATFSTLDNVGGHNLNPTYWMQRGWLGDRGEEYDRLTPISTLTATITAADDAKVAEILKHAPDLAQTHPDKAALLDMLAKAKEAAEKGNDAEDKNVAALENAIEAHNKALEAAAKAAAAAKAGAPAPAPTTPAPTTPGPTTPAPAAPGPAAPPAAPPAPGTPAPGTPAPATPGPTGSSTGVPGAGSGLFIPLPGTPLPAPPGSGAPSGGGPGAVAPTGSTATKAPAYSATEAEKAAEIARKNLEIINTLRPKIEALTIAQADAVLAEADEDELGKIYNKHGMLEMLAFAGGRLQEGKAANMKQVLALKEGYDDYLGSIENRRQFNQVAGDFGNFLNPFEGTEYEHIGKSIGAWFGGLWETSKDIFGDLSDPHGSLGALGPKILGYGGAIVGALMVVKPFMTMLITKSGIEKLPVLGGIISALLQGGALIMGVLGLGKLGSNLIVQGSGKHAVDTLRGGEAEDKLEGSSGDDTLSGGTGNDNLGASYVPAAKAQPHAGGMPEIQALTGNDPKLEKAVALGKTPEGAKAAMARLQQLAADGYDTEGLVVLNPKGVYEHDRKVANSNAANQGETHHVSLHYEQVGAYPQKNNGFIHPSLTQAANDARDYKAEAVNHNELDAKVMVFADHSPRQKRKPISFKDLPMVNHDDQAPRVA